MKILFLTPLCSYPPDGGGKIRDYNILTRLAKNHEIILVTFVSNKLEKSGLPVMKKYCSKVYGISGGLTNINSVLRNLFTLSPLHVTVYGSRKMEKIIENILRSEKIDLIHCSFLYMAQYINGLPLKGTIKVWDQHNVDRFAWDRLANQHPNIFCRIFSWINKIKTQRFEELCSKNFDLCMSVSQADMEQTKKFVFSKMRLFLAPNGVDINYFSLRKSEKIENNTIVFCGSMNYEPNVVAVIYFCKRIFPIITETNPEVKLYIVGGYPPRSVYRLADGKRITVTGRVEDVRPYLESTTVSIAPFTLGGGTKLKVLEAMAMGIPVVSTSVGCQGIDVSNQIDILIADNAEKFAESVLKLLKDKDMQKEISKNARKLVESKYNWDYIVENIEKKYVDLLSQQG